MRIESISINNVRKIAPTTLEPGARFNLITGPNGSGKTTLLEAIHILGMARSFRTVQARHIITNGRSELLVAGKAVSSGGESVALGVEKTARHTRIRVDGETASNASALARILPMLVLNAESHTLLTGGPANRRALLDRTLFHVEHRYLDWWKSYHRALIQRNALLRNKARLRDGVYWNRELDGRACAIDEARRACIVALNKYLENVDMGGFLGRIRLQYARGWGDGSLAEKLDQTWLRDMSAGTTQIGAHRAEIRILVDGEIASASVSRGQGKLLLAAIVHAQANYMTVGDGTKPVVLVDDLPAELDANLREKAVSMLYGLGGQAFFTAINPATLPELCSFPTRLFHVEQGAVRSETPLVS